MFIEKSIEELANDFENNLLDTNRGYNYYIDWSNIDGYQKYEIEIHAMDTMIGKDDKELFVAFKKLMFKLPTIIEVFPYLFLLDLLHVFCYHGGGMWLCEFPSALPLWCW